ncbi:hypothetical protein [Flindersiella endophytica]
MQPVLVTDPASVEIDDLFVPPAVTEVLFGEAPQGVASADRYPLRGDGLVSLVVGRLRFAFGRDGVGRRRASHGLSEWASGGHRNDGADQDVSGASTGEARCGCEVNEVRDHPENDRQREESPGDPPCDGECGYEDHAHVRMHQEVLNLLQAEDVFRQWVPGRRDEHNRDTNQ